VVRWLIFVGFALLGNALGLLVADWILDDVSLGASGFIIDVLIFTGALVLARPLFASIGLKHAPALTGSSALVATLVALIVTVILSDSLAIDGAATWILATIIIWIVGLAAGLLLPAIFLKKAVVAGQSQRGVTTYGR
jgi:putative membrane protein